MKAIGVFAFGGPERLQVVDLPRPEPGQAEVRIRVDAAGVNRTDALFRSGARAAELAGRPPPYIPGMDASGTISAVGPGGDGRLAVGDRVMAYVMPTGSHGGAYAEEIVVPAASVVAAPRGATPFEAATVLLNAVTARLALDALALPPGATLLVTGAAGAVGGYAIQLARAAGLRVIADSGSASDEALVRALGAEWVLARGDGFWDRVRTIAPAGVNGLGGPGERGIAVHAIVSPREARNTAMLDRLRRDVDDKILTLRVAEVLPASHATEAHRRLEAGGVRGRLVLNLREW